MAYGVQLTSAGCAGERHGWADDLSRRRIADVVFLVPFSTGSHLCSRGYDVEAGLCSDCPGVPACGSYPMKKLLGVWRLHFCASTTLQQNLHEHVRVHSLIDPTCPHNMRHAMFLAEAQ